MLPPWTALSPCWKTVIRTDPPMKLWIPCPENFPDLNVIAIYNTTGLRFYHTNRKETGETFVGGEEEAILKGMPALYHHRLRYKRFPAAGFPFDRNSDGAIIGFVIASVFNTYISEQIHEVFSYLFISSDGHAARQHPSVSRTRLPSPGFPDGTSSDGDFSTCICVRIPC